MDPIIGGAIIGGVGRLVGGLFGNKSAKQQQAQAIKWEKNKLAHTVAEADRLGIHRSLALGSNLSYGNPFVGSGTNHVGNSIAGAADTVANAVGQISQRKMQKEAHDKNLRIADSEIIRNQAEAEAALIHARAATLSASRPSSVMTDDGPVPTHIAAQLPDGTIIQYPNPDLAIGAEEYPVMKVLQNTGLMGAKIKESKENKHGIRTTEHEKRKRSRSKTFER